MSFRSDSLCIVILAAAALLAPTMSRADDAAQPLPLPPLPILDMHLHARDAPETARTLCLPVTTYGVVDPDCAEPLVSPATDEEMVARTVEILERRNVYGVISDDSLEIVRRFVDAAPGRLLPALELDLGEPEAVDLETLRRLVEAGDIAILGEIGNQYSGIAPDDERMEPYWALAEELGLPVALHLGEGYPGAPYLGSPDYRVRLGSPLLLEEVLVRHPELRIYVMHYGSPLVDEMLAILYTYPQVYIDVGGNIWPYGNDFFCAQLRRFVDAGFGRRILFGSDQMVWPELIEISLDGLDACTFLTEEQKRNILYDNAARFLRLSEEEIARHHGRR